MAVRSYLDQQIQNEAAARAAGAPVTRGSFTDIAGREVGSDFVQRALGNIPSDTQPAPPAYQQTFLSGLLAQLQNATPEQQQQVARFAPQLQGLLAPILQDVGRQDDEGDGTPGGTYNERALFGEHEKLRAMSAQELQDYIDSKQFNRQDFVKGMFPSPVFNLAKTAYNVDQNALATKIYDYKYGPGEDASGLIIGPDLLHPGRTQVPVTPDQVAGKPLSLLPNLLSVPDDAIRLSAAARFSERNINTPVTSEELPELTVSSDEQYFHPDMGR